MSTLSSTYVVSQYMLAKLPQVPWSGIELVKKTNSNKLSKVPKNAIFNAFSWFKCVRGPRKSGRVQGCEYH